MGAEIAEKIMMTYIKFAKLLLLLCTLLFSNTALSRDDGLVVCNGSNDDKLKIAMIYYSGTYFVKKWESLGWYTVKPSGCERLLEGTNFVNNSYYLSVIKVLPNGEQHIYVTKNIGIEEFFCVRELGKFKGGFSLTRASLSELKKCPTDYSLQLFTIFIRSKEHTRYKLNL